MKPEEIPDRVNTYFGDDDAPLSASKMAAGCLAFVTVLAVSALVVVGVVAFAIWAVRAAL